MYGVKIAKALMYKLCIWEAIQLSHTCVMMRWCEHTKYLVSKPTHHPKMGAERWWVLENGDTEVHVARLQRWTVMHWYLLTEEGTNLTDQMQNRTSHQTLKHTLTTIMTNKIDILAAFLWNAALLSSMVGLKSCSGRAWARTPTLVWRSYCNHHQYSWSHWCIRWDTSPRKTAPRRGWMQAREAASVLPLRMTHPTRTGRVREDL